VHTPVNHISFEQFFAWLGETVTSLGFEALPPDVHLSIAHNPKSLYNIHFTRNCKGNSTNKPRIRIVQFDKEHLENAWPFIRASMFDTFFERLHIDFRNRERAIRAKGAYRYLSHTRLEREQQPQQEISEIIERASTMKGKKKLKILNTIVPDMEDWANKPATRKMIWANFKPIHKEIRQWSETGYLVSPGYSGLVINIQGNFFKFKEQAGIKEILTKLLGEELRKRLVFKTLLAIKRVSMATTYQDTEMYDRPILMVCPKHQG